MSTINKGVIEETKPVPGGGFVSPPGNAGRVIAEPDRLLSFGEMGMEKLIIIFFAILLAGLGEKTRLATFLYAPDRNVSKTAIFFTTAVALVLCMGIAVLIGEKLSALLSPDILNTVAGSGFVLIGFWILLQMLQ